MKILRIFTRARILSAKVLGAMSENNSRGYLATDPNAGTYGIDTKRGKTYKRRQPREKRGTERGSHSTVTKRTETRVNKYTISIDFLLCIVFFFTTPV